MDSGGSDWKYFLMFCCQNTRCVMRGEQEPLVETEGYFDSSQTKHCTERWVIRGGWHSPGHTKALRWHPTGWQSTGRQSLSLGCLGVLGSQCAADLRKAWQQSGPSPELGIRTVVCGAVREKANGQGRRGTRPRQAVENGAQSATNPPQIVTKIVNTY